MLAGRWDSQNGESIKINKDGILCDAHHRLTGLLKAAKTNPAIVVPMLITFNVSENAFETIDKGKARSPSDVLSIYGEKHTVLLAAALRLVKSHEAGDFRLIVRLENDEIKDVLDRHERIRESIDFYHKLSIVKGLLEPTSVIFLHYVFSEKDKEAADSFIKKLLEGCDLSEGSPIFVLRKQLLRMMGHNDGYRKYYSRDQRDMKIIFCIKAWNTLRSGGRTVDHFTSTVTKLPPIK
jgi:hypothetical protein